MDASMFRALAHRNFRLFFFGQTVSLIGTWMQQIAMQWLVFSIVPEPEWRAWWLGMVSFCALVPSFFLAPVAGVLVDRWNRHRLVVFTQTLAMIQAFVLAGLTLSDIIDRWQLLGLSLVLGVVNVFDMTARQAFLTEMVTRREDLANAIALNSSMFNGARLIGPALAGLTLAFTSAGICFLLNALSFVAVLIALLAMRVEPRRTQTAHPNVLQGLSEGFRYVFGSPPIRAILLLVALVSLTGTSYSTLLPVFATDELHGGPETFGWLSAAAGVGALAGALFLAQRKTIVGLGRWLVGMPMLFGAGLIGLSFSKDLGLALAVLVVIGFAIMVQLAASNTILQTIVDEDMRGRMMSFYALAFMGVSPLGSLLAGWLAGPRMLGAPHTVLAGGCCCIAGGILFALQLPRLRAHIRPIYTRMGILPEVAAGIQAATTPTANAEPWQNDGGAPTLPATR